MDAFIQYAKFEKLKFLNLTNWSATLEIIQLCSSVIVTISAFGKATPAVATDFVLICVFNEVARLPTFQRIKAAGTSHYCLCKTWQYKSSHLRVILSRSSMKSFRSHVHPKLLMK